SFACFAVRKVCRVRTAAKVRKHRSRFESQPSRFTFHTLRTFRTLRTPQLSTTPRFPIIFCVRRSVVALRSNHYDAAFEAFLRTERRPYVAVDEARRALAPHLSVNA